ncbi:hypothetical protein BC937DRAFT_91656 [Endogone sp. FLAS-F59071]|nr:hypothetical protein BC937DRAFT_91656 [Endogone sp. FLAS-F59071]|eukprot:RUS16050.1 hypothetical protein BC937DRAFT_91656 [Endogone sp. FLAS-F59071]
MIDAEEMIQLRSIYFGEQTQCEDVYVGFCRLAWINYGMKDLEIRSRHPDTQTLENPVTNSCLDIYTTFPTSQLERQSASFHLFISLQRHSPTCEIPKKHQRLTFIAAVTTTLLLASSGATANPPADTYCNGFNLVEATINQIQAELPSRPSSCWTVTTSASVSSTRRPSINPDAWAIAQKLDYERKKRLLRRPLRGCQSL